VRGHVLRFFYGVRAIEIGFFRVCKSECFKVFHCQHQSPVLWQCDDALMTTLPRVDGMWVSTGAGNDCPLEWAFLFSEWVQIPVGV